MTTLIEDLTNDVIGSLTDHVQLTDEQKDSLHTYLKNLNIPLEYKTQDRYLKGSFSYNYVENLLDVICESSDII